MDEIVGDYAGGFKMRGITGKNELDVLFWNGKKNIKAKVK